MNERKWLRWIERHIADEIPDLSRLLLRFVSILFAAMLIWMITTRLLAKEPSAAVRDIPPSAIVIFVTTGALLLFSALSTLNKRVFLDYDGPPSRASSAELRRVLYNSREANAVSTKPDAIQSYSDLAKSSRSLAASLYNRSGVYLVSGVSLAVAGIATFYFLRPQLAAGSSGIDLFVALLPGSSMLLLVELIAFFFLRQSRAVMDEFRHFDHLARNREEVLAALRLAAESGKPLDLTDLMVRGFYFTRGERLSSGETTEIVETRKLEKTEIDLLNKVVELISAKKA